MYIATTSTDWHPDTWPWLYDSLPVSKGDCILKLQRADPQLLEHLASLENPRFLKEDLAPLKLEAETYDFETRDADLANGNKLYQQYCAACHRPNGVGSIGNIPPLVNSEWVQEDKVRLIDVMLRGLNAPIRVDGVDYEGEMPSYAYLKDKEIRDILNFIRTQFGKT